MTTIEDKTSRVLEGKQFSSFNKYVEEQKPGKIKRASCLTAADRNRMADLMLAREVDNIINDDISNYDPLS